MRFLALVLLLVNLKAQAQNSTEAILELVEAERAFSKMSEQVSTTAAFLHFFAADAISIVDGKEVAAQDELRKQKPGSALLVWEPIYADIAASLDFGYTTGPYRLFKSRNDSTLLGSGYYSSMWQKQSNGEWKVLFDLGSSVLEPTVPALHLPRILPGNKYEKVDKDWALNVVLKIDQNYIAQLNSLRSTIIAKYFHEESRIHRPGIVPQVNTQVQVYKDPPGQTTLFTQLNGRIANSGDLAFTYGTAITSRKDAENIHLRYFRIWKKLEGQWRIVFDLLG